MESILIGTNHHISEIRHKLDFRFLVREGIDVKVKENCKGDLTFLEYNISNNQLSNYPLDYLKSILRYYIANAIADIVIDDLEERIIAKIISQDYCYLSQSEQNLIAEYAFRSLRNYQNNFEIVYMIERKRKVLEKVLEYFDSNNELIIEGFINFRLKDYIQELREIVDRAVDEYRVEKEYLEFIQLLKYFVDIQEPRMDEVHVVIESPCLFKILDSTGQTINSEYLKDFICEVANNDINYEDLLISALITLAPKQIVIHRIELIEQKNIINTIKNIFEERIIFCQGCHFCTPQNKSGVLVEKQQDDN